MANDYKILWADDEIDLLKPHILFLKAKGYDVETANNGADALDAVEMRHFDMVILDENMPGLTGLETLQRIKVISPSLPAYRASGSPSKPLRPHGTKALFIQYTTLEAFCQEAKRSNRPALPGSQTLV